MTPASFMLQQEAELWSICNQRQVPGLTMRAWKSACFSRSLSTGCANLPPKLTSGLHICKVQAMWGQCKTGWLGHHSSPHIYLCSSRGADMAAMSVYQVPGKTALKRSLCLGIATPDLEIGCMSHIEDGKVLPNAVLLQDVVGVRLYSCHAEKVAMLELTAVCTYLQESKDILGVGEAVCLHHQHAW